jgi:diadenosine tetraphosphate (Ap4A) HIT family hydrolase
MRSCLICDRIEQIRNDTNRFFVKELVTGYVVIGDHQFYPGYTVFLSKIHSSELHTVEKKFRDTFLCEMATVAEAVYRAFRPNKLNYELLGNTDEHMHWHIFPRRKSDPKPYTAVWAVDKGVRGAEATKPSDNDLKILKQKLLRELDKLV